MATSKRAQNKAGVPSRRRGQQMGDERSAPDKSAESKKQTPAQRGRRKAANKFFADDSSQMTGSRPEVARFAERRSQPRSRAVSMTSRVVTASSRVTGGGAWPRIAAATPG